MKTYLISFCASRSHQPEHPDRTAKKDVGLDLLYQVWASRAAMVTTIRMQQKRAARQGDWRPCVPLSPADD